MRGWRSAMSCASVAIDAVYVACRFCYCNSADGTDCIVRRGRPAPCPTHSITAASPVVARPSLTGTGWPSAHARWPGAALMRNAFDGRVTGCGKNWFNLRPNSIVRRLAFTTAPVPCMLRHTGVRSFCVGYIT